MALIPLVDPDAATGRTKEQLDEIRAAFGTVPAMFRTVAQSPAALTSMWTAFGAFGSSSALGAAVGEQIAVAVANRNSCEYCLAAHSALGRRAGVSREAMAAAQTGRSDDPIIAAILAFALKLVEERGSIGPSDVEELRAHGVTDEQIVEIVAQVALNLFTNYLNVALDVPVDFPTVPLRRKA
ncbi:peroxidase-related enzyme [Rathayibacter sp. VKM Ac-2801]|uniref:carboxymuconolactone decarboxylase family protein n=1 Tax=Rathayibacter sp. VKM Ac-2801 TaxID=2609255 RepID=UPI0013204B43|nr:peroxidase-related enzyme [Rathayibacter sp. VKM Ac-2801]QHC69526.1 peroxidase-related enzyme [Rathayibacter sp. VKM Ac-2801]